MKLKILFGVACVVAASTAVLLPTAAANAIPTSWPSGTVFVATAGTRTSNGALDYIEPGQSPQTLSFSPASDVAVGPDGTVYWASCSGSVLKYDPAGPGYAQPVWPSLGDCPHAIAVEPDGDVLVGTYDSLYRFTAPDYAKTVLVPDVAPSGIAVDAADNIYFLTGGHLNVIPAGGVVAQVGTFDSFASMQSLRLTLSGQLLGATGSSHDVLSANLGSGTVTSVLTTGDYLLGATVDTHGDVYASDLADDPSTGDQVDRVSGGVETTYATGFDTPDGLATYPQVLPNRQAPTQTTLSTKSTSTPSTTTVVKLVATVTGATVGYVQFDDGGLAIGSPVRVHAGVATLSTTLPLGTDVVNATFLGGTKASPSQSSSLTFDVGEATTTTLQTSTGTTVPDGGEADFTATVTSDAGTPSGTVSFLVDGIDRDDEPVASDGTATSTLTLGGRASSQVRARFVPSTGWLASTSAQITITTAAPFVPTLTNTTGTGADQGGLVRATVTVRIRGYGGEPLPTGTVVADNGFTCTALSGTTVAVSTCKGAVSDSANTVVHLDYSGDSEYDASETTANFDFAT